jgi:hypothetical protein
MVAVALLIAGAAMVVAALVLLFCWPVGLLAAGLFALVAGLDLASDRRRPPPVAPVASGAVGRAA